MLLKGNQAYPGAYAVTPCLGHPQFSLGRRELFLSLVLAAAVSLRGASREVELLGTVLARPEAVPSWDTGRLW
jgi:hypothetical protein